MCIVSGRVRTGRKKPKSSSSRGIRKEMAVGKVEDRENLLAGMSWCGCQLGARSKAQTKES